MSTTPSAHDGPAGPAGLIDPVHADRTRIAVQPTTRTVADSAIVLSTIMAGTDTNLYGTVHGGVVMKLVDDAAAAAAARHAGGPAVTVAVERMEFRRPAQVGDLLTARARLVRVGRTSMDVTVTVTAERWNAPGDLREIVTAALRFVAVDATGTPRPVPALLTGD